jgi:hypothetical protein
MKLRNLMAIMLVAVLATGVAMAGKCGSKKSACGKCDKAKTEAVAKEKAGCKCDKAKGTKPEGGCKCDKAKAAKAKGGCKK